MEGILLHDLQYHHIEVNYRCRDGEERGVEAVEQATVTGKDVAAVLDANLALEEAFNEVAPCAKDAYGERQAHPLPEFHILGFVSVDAPCCRKAEQTATDASYPRLLGRNAGEEFGVEVTTQQIAHKVSTCVAHPKEDEDGEGEDEVVLHGVCKTIVAQSQHGEEGEGECDVHLRCKGVCPVLQGIGFLTVEFAYQYINECKQVGHKFTS